MIGVIRSVERLLRQSLHGFENHLDLECGVQGFSPKTHGSFGNRHPECSRVAARAYKRSEAIRERCAGTACKLESTRNTVYSCLSWLGRQAHVQSRVVPYFGHTLNLYLLLQGASWLLNHGRCPSVRDVSDGDDSRGCLSRLQSLHEGISDDLILQAPFDQANATPTLDVTKLRKCNLAMLFFTSGKEPNVSVRLT